MCRGYFYFAEARRNFDLAYSFCPVECVEKGYHAGRARYCEECPHARERTRFQETAETLIRDRLGRVKFRFDDLLETLYRVAALEEKTRADLSVKAAVLGGVFLSEKARFEREQEIEKETTKGRN